MKKLFLILISSTALSFVQAEDIDLTLTRKGDPTALLNPVGLSQTNIIPNSTPGKKEPTVNQSIKSVPGLFQTEKNILGTGIGPATSGTISIRGSKTGQRSLFLIDGRPDAMGIFGHPLNDSYGMNNVDRIQVTRGPDSVRYGSGALGGSINIIPKRMRKNGWMNSLASFGGSYGTWGSVLENGYKNDKMDYLVTGSYQSSDGHRPHSGANLGYINGITGIKLSNAQEVIVAARHTDTYVQDPGSLSELATAQATGVNVDKWSRMQRSATNLTFNSQTVGHPWVAKAFADYGANTIRNQSIPSNTYFWDSIDRTFGGSFVASPLLNGAQQIDIGLDAKAAGGTGQNLTANISYLNQYQTQGGIFSIYKAEMSPNLKGSVGAREHFHQQYGAEFIPQAGVEYSPFSKTSLRTSISKGFRSPTLFEIWNKLYPNDNLNPEVAWNYEAGFNQRFGSNVTWDFTGFVLEGSNLIRSQRIGAAQKFFNSGSFRHKGIETGINAIFAEQFQINATASLLDPENETQGNPKQHYLFSMDYLLKKWTMGFTTDYVANIYEADNSQQPLPNYTITGVGLNYKPLAWLNLFGRIENLFNESYQIVTGYPMPGRTYSAGAKVEF